MDPGSLLLVFGLTCLDAIAREGNLGSDLLNTFNSITFALMYLDDVRTQNLALERKGDAVNSSDIMIWGRQATGF